MQFLRVLGWIGTVLALAVAAVAGILFFLALGWAALEPVVREFVEERRARKILKASARYARRFGGAA